LIDGPMSCGFRTLIAGGFSILDGPASVHQFMNERQLLLRTKIRIAHSPQLPANDKISAVRRHWMFQTSHDSDQGL
jgi:hypothetical protein